MAAASDVTIVLANPYAGKEPGDKLTVSAEEARNLFRAGIARSDDKLEDQAEKKARKARKAEQDSAAAPK